MPHPGGLERLTLVDGPLPRSASCAPLPSGRGCERPTEERVSVSRSFEGRARVRNSRLNAERDARDGVSPARLVKSERIPFFHIWIQRGGDLEAWCKDTTGRLVWLCGMAWSLLGSVGSLSAGFISTGNSTSTPAARCRSVRSRPHSTRRARSGRSSTLDPERASVLEVLEDREGCNPVLERGIAGRARTTYAMSGQVPMSQTRGSQRQGDIEYGRNFRLQPLEVEGLLLFERDTCEACSLACRKASDDQVDEV